MCILLYYYRLWLNEKKYLIQSINGNTTSSGAQSTDIGYWKGRIFKYVEQTLRMLYDWRHIKMLEMNVKEDHTCNNFYTPQIIDIRSNENAKR